VTMRTYRKRPLRSGTFLITGGEGARRVYLQGGHVLGFFLPERERSVLGRSTAESRFALPGVQEAIVEDQPRGVRLSFVGTSISGKAARSPKTRRKINDEKKSKKVECELMYSTKDLLFQVGEKDILISLGKLASIGRTRSITSSKPSE